MSQLVTVKIREGVFTSLTCLEKSLDELGLNFLNIEQTEQGHYSIALSKASVRDGQVSSVKQNLKDTAQSLLLKIQPVYARLLAIQELKQKGFTERKRTQSSEGEYILMEREIPLKDGGGFERIEITIHNDNTITLNHHNFVGRSCVKVSDKLVRQLGSVIDREMKPEAESKLQAKTQDRNRLRI